MTSYLAGILAEVELMIVIGSWGGVDVLSAGFGW